MEKTDKGLAVLVTTAHRGVFFGYTHDPDAEILELKSARNCVYWTADVHGFLGLAADGPSPTCRIGPRADIRLRDITSVSSVTPAAVDRWESATWTP